MKNKKINNIRSIDFPESIRTRPVMYMGDISNSDHALTESVDNVADHIFRDKTVKNVFIKSCKKAGEYFVVANDGIPFPIEKDTKREKTKADLASTHMHTGSNFDGLSTSIGQNGVGLKGTNALSEYFYIITRIENDSHLKSIDSIKNKGKNGKYYFLRYERGIKTHEAVDILSKIAKIDKLILPKGFSTIIVSKPDSLIYENPIARVNISRIEDSILLFKNFYKRDISYVVDGVKIKSDTIGNKFKALTSYNISGIKYRKTKIENGKEVPDTSSQRVIDNKKKVSLKFLLDFEFSKDLESSISTGNINTRPVNKGIHINSAKDLVGQCLKEVFDIQHNYVTKGISINSLVLAPGSHLQLSGQTKDSLLRIKYFQDKVFDKSAPSKVLKNDWGRMKSRIKKIITENKDIIAPHVSRLNDYALSLQKIASKDYVKSILQLSNNTNPVRKLNTKHLRNASSFDRSKCTLYIVEGKSAASSLLEARDPSIHGIFTMRGYGLNTVGVPLNKVFNNDEFRELIIGINAGVDVHNDISKIQFSKIVIAADADPDGLAITSLILTMFGQHLKFMLDKGLVFVNESPLYYQKGKYFRSYERHLLDTSKPFTRFKGLGELNTEQAYDVFFGKHKKLIKITPEGIDKALNLMSETSEKKKLMNKNKIIITD